jgi:hypothetical protein
MCFILMQISSITYQNYNTLIDNILIQFIKQKTVRLRDMVRTVMIHLWVMVTCPEITAPYCTGLSSPCRLSLTW